MYHNFKITVMKKKDYLWSLLVIVMAATLSVGLSSCKDDDDPEPTLKVSPTSIQLDALGEGVELFDIECNTTWMIDVDEDWLHVSSESGFGDDVIEVYADDNNDSKRTATITITTKGAQLSKKVRVTQAEGENLVVTPLDPRLEAEKGSTITISITTNSSWNISGIPVWVSLSSSQGGSGTTTINLTAKESNFSDEERSANFIVTAGTKSATITVIQEPKFSNQVTVNVANELIMSSGYYADLKFSNKVLGYHEGYYYKYAFDVKTEEDIYNEVIEGNILGAEDYDYTYIYGLSPSTEYVYCCIPYSGDSKSRVYGKMLIKNFKTKSNSTYCDATVSGSYNSSYWSYTISKQQRCHHYYLMYATDSFAEYWYDTPTVLLALAIRDRINDKTNFPNYDYFLNDGTTRIARTNGDYAFFIWTWGVDDTNEFSGNIQGAYANLSSSAQQIKNLTDMSENNDLKPVKKVTRVELNNMKKNLNVIEYPNE